MKARVLASIAAVGIAATALIAPAASAATDRPIKASEVTKHNTAASCWTIVGKNVYDVTKWESKHPGGASSIKLMCGKNGTALFNGKHGSSGSAKAVLGKYKIGHVVK